MTRRGRLALALGAVLYLVAWLTGSPALYPVAVGLVLAPLLAWVWLALAPRPVRLARQAGRPEHYEGDDVDVALELEVELGVLPPAPVVARERLSKLGRRETKLRRAGGRRLSARYVLPALRRGRYAVEEASAVLQDPFGLATHEVDLTAPATLLVYPRLVELDALFSDSGAMLADGRRLLMRRPSGFELHSVRDHEQGESLRRVHWPSTAKRGSRRVKELEDAPRAEVAVLLDARASRASAAAFDAQVRAAGSILRAHVKRSRRTVLLVNGAVQEQLRANTLEDWAPALELLAAAEPDGRRPVELLLSEEASLVSRALELAVVTSVLTPGLVERVVQRALARRHVSLVYVDAGTFEGRPRRREPGLLRLQAAGVPLAVVGTGDDLAAALAPAPVPSVEVRRA